MINDKTYEVILKNEGLIYKIASNYSSNYNINVLYQAGCTGIIKALQNYKESNDIKFSSYAYKYVLGEIIDYIKKDRNIIISDDAYSIYKRYLKVKDLLLNKNEREPTIKEISEFMNINELDLVRIIESALFTSELDYSYEGYTDNREEIDDKILLENELNNLDKFSNDLIKYRYYKGYTQSETASLLGVNQVKVSRQEKLILNRIKESISNN